MQGEVMKCLASTHFFVIWVAQSYSFYQRNLGIVHGGEPERDTLSEAAVSSRAMVTVTFVTWSSSGTEFLIEKLLYNDIFVDVLFTRLPMGQRKKVVAFFA